MQRRKLVSIALVVPPVFALASLALPVPYRYYAQIAAALIFLSIYAALGVQYFRELREIKRTRARQDAVFQSFVDAHVPPRNED